MIALAWKCAIKKAPCRAFCYSSVRRVLSTRGIPEEVIISLGRLLPGGSSGGVHGTSEPKRIPRTQILLASPRVYQSGWTRTKRISASPEVIQIPGSRGVSPSIKVQLALRPIRCTHGKQSQGESLTSFEIRHCGTGPTLVFRYAPARRALPAWRSGEARTFLPPALPARFARRESTVGRPYS